MKINFLNYNNHYYMNKQIAFNGTIGDLEKLSQIEELLKQQYEVEVAHKENFLADTYIDIDTAKQTIQILKDRLNSQKQEINQRDMINKSARESLLSIIPGIQLLTEQKKEYEDKIKQIPEYRKQLQVKADALVLQKRQESLSRIKSFADKINNSVQDLSPELQCINIPKSDGFATIAGFRKVKELIKACLGEPIALEKAGVQCDVPSGILFYGPDSSNNLNIAKAIANQFDCNYEIVSSDIDNSSKMEFLENIAKRAKNNFSAENKRTLIIIDDFDNFIPATKRNRGIFKDFMDKISSVDKATVIAISQNPAMLDPIALRDGRFNKIPIPTASLKDIVEMVKKYIPLDLLDQVDIIDFAKQIFKSQGTNAFSVKQIKEIILSFANDFSKIQHIKPEISKDKILHFKKQVKLLKSI